MFLLTSVVLYAIVLHVVQALPLEKRIVINPQITSPNAGTVWTPGKTELVTWDTSAVPSTGDFPGTILFGQLTPGSENLDVDHPLATDFSLRDGSVTVTCPTVQTGNTYIIVLMGDSGNASPQFTISGPDGSSGSPASSSSQPSPSPSSVEPGSATPQQAPAPSTTSVSPSPTNPAPSSDSSSPSWTPGVTPSSSTTTLPASSPTAYAKSSTSSSGSSSASSASAVSNSPASGLNANSAIARTWNAGAIVTCAFVTAFTMLSL